MKKIGVALLNTENTSVNQLIAIIERHENKFSIELIAGSNKENLIALGLKHSPNIVCVAHEDVYKDVENALWENDIKTYCGFDAIGQSLENENIHVVYNGYQDYSSLKPLIFGLKSHKKILLDNDFGLLETGNLLHSIAAENNAQIIPTNPITQFFWEQLQFFDIKTIKSFSLQVSHTNDQGLKGIIAAFKLMPNFLKLPYTIQLFEDNSTSIIIELKNGTSISISRTIDQLHALEQALLYPEFLENESKHIFKKHVIEKYEGEITDLNTFIKSDSYALQNSSLSLNNPLQLVIDNIKKVVDNSSAQKAETSQDVMTILKASNRID